jgi:hypothetical protein
VPIGTGAKETENKDFGDRVTRRFERGDAVDASGEAGICPMFV